MSGSTINNTVTVGVTLGTVSSVGGTYASPLTITSTGAVTLSGTGDAIFGPGTQAWTVVNNGSIAVAGTTGNGIALALGSVDNAGLIEGPTGVRAGAGGAVVNTGTIEGTGTAGVGVVLNLGGTLTNSGMIAGAATGVYIAGAIGTLVNTGTIQDTGTAGTGLTLYGGSIANGASNATAALIRGVQYGAEIGSAAGTVVNYGTIAATATSGEGLRLVKGGTIDNLGTIEGPSSGIFLDTATSLTNGRSGTTVGYIAGQTGVNMQTPGIVTNYGRIAGTASGLYFVRGGTVHNFGTIAGGGTAGGGVDFGFLNAGAVVVNGQSGGTAGLITASGAGVSFNENGGTVTNYGAITGGSDGLALSGTVAVVVNNFGTITGSAAGAYITGTAGATVVNSGTGTMTGGAEGVEVRDAAGTVTNSGTIGGNGTAGVGIVLIAGGTVIDSGTITGAGGTSISFGGTGTNFLVLEHGYRLVGDILLSASASNTVNLAGSVGSAVTAGAGFVLPAANFQDLLFGPGGYDTAQVKTPTTLTSYTWPVTISGFTLTSETIDMTRLAGATLGNGGTVNGSGQLVIGNGTQSVTLQLDASDGTVFTTSSDGATGTDIAPLCFCRGTLILTDRGEVPVEALAVGDRVETLSGAFKPIVWIGFGRDLVTRRNSLARPIIVRRGALSDNVPRRDLYLTHGHALYVDGVLIPVEHLVNHRSILWDDAARIVEYYHIELDGHDVVFAEGAAAETYYDSANRALFHNTRAGSMAGGARPTFAPVLHEGEFVGKIWAGLLARVGGLIDADTTGDPDLHILADGKRLDPVSRDDGVYTFTLANPPAGALLLRSRSAVPSLLGLSRHDHRRLGVAIRQIILSGPGVMTCLDLDAPLFREGGGHLPEGGHCWTDGELAVPTALLAHLSGAFTLIVHTRKQAMRYPLCAPVRQAA